MILIGELVKALNLYSNPGVGNHSHENKNSKLEVHLKSFGCKRLNLVSLSDMVLVLQYSTLCDYYSLFFCFLCFQDLHCITFMHFILGCFCLFFFFQIKKKGRKMKQIVFCTIFLVLKTRLVNLFSYNMSFVPCLTLMSLLIALYQLKFCSACCVGNMFMVLITFS